MRIHVQLVREAHREPIGRTVESLYVAPGIETQAFGTAEHRLRGDIDRGDDPTLDAVVRGLNALGASPRDIIAIMQALKAAGALRAELVIL